MSASDAGADAHEGTEGAAALHCRLAHRGQQLSAPQPVPEGREPAEEGARGEADTEAHHESHLDLVEAAGLPHGVGAGRGGRHLNVI